MITYEVLSKVEDSLDTILDAHIVPETEAYPTSGSTFVRVSGESTSINFLNDAVQFSILFSVTCSIRTRDYLKQNKRRPYQTLLDLQERCFFHLTSSSDVITALYSLGTGVSVSGRYESTNLNTRVVPVYPDFFGSEDFSSRREAGYVLSQTYSSPLITVPFQCITYPPIPPE